MSPESSTTPEDKNRALLDAPTFIESCLSIVDRFSQKVPFILNDVQKSYLADRTRLDIILKARKMGFSTLIIALWIHACITRQHTYAVIVSHEKKATQRLLRRALYMLKNSVIPINFKHAGEEIIFPDTNSVLYIGTAGSKSFGRGDDITHAHLSEGAFYKYPDIVTSVQQAMFEGGDTWFVAESTANGAGTPYHEFCLKAQKGESNFKLHFYPWFSDSGYSTETKPLELDKYEMDLRINFGVSWGQVAWRRKKMRDMEDPSLFPQEFPATIEEAFLASGRMVFDWGAILAQEKTAADEIWRGNIADVGGEVKVELDPKGPLIVYRTPDARKRYLITADTAEGVTGGDFSVADVWDFDNGEQVAQWRDRMAPDRFATILRRLGCYYNWGLIACERNFPGNTVNSRLVDIVYGDQYPNIYYEAKKKHEEMTPGFRTTEKLKTEMVADGRAALRELDLKVNSRYTHTELKTFVVQENGSMEAQKGCFDDAVITFVAAAFILKRLILFPEDRNNVPRNKVRAFKRPSQPSRRLPGRARIV